MATRIWGGTSSGSWVTAGNWSGAAAPVDNDIAIVPEANTVPISSGLGDIDIDLDLLMIERGNDNDLGTSGQSLELVADKIIHRGGGTLYFHSSKTTGATTTDEMIIDSQNKILAASLTDDGASENISNIKILQGKVVIESGINAVPLLQVTYLNNSGSDSIVTIEAGAGAVAILMMNGGTVTCDAAITTLYQSGGTLTQDTATVTTAVVSGGTFNFNFGGTIAALNILGGLVDFTQSTSAKVVTALRVLTGARFLFNKDFTTFTFEQEEGGGGIREE